MNAERHEATHTIPADVTTIYAVLRDPQGHVSVDSSGRTPIRSGATGRSPGWGR
jgi:hypothetical protein